MHEKPQVVIVFPDDHPHSKASLRSQSPDCRQRLEQEMATWSLRCPNCLGLLPAESIYCAWCANQVRCLVN